MTDYYLKQILDFNKEAETFIKLDKDWILSFDNVTELGIAVKQKMLQKIIDLQEDNKRIQSVIDNLKNKI